MEAQKEIELLKQLVKVQEELIAELRKAIPKPIQISLTDVQLPYNPFEIKWGPQGPPKNPGYYDSGPTCGCCQTYGSAITLCQGSTLNPNKG